MPEVLREIDLPNTNFSSPDSLNENDRAEHDGSKPDFDEGDQSKEKDQEQTQERNTSGKENVSMLDYGARDESQSDDDDDNWSRLDSDPFPEENGLSEEFFRSSASSEAALALAELPNIINPSTPCDPSPNENRHPIVATLRAVAASKVPDLSPLQELLRSEDLPASIREAYPHELVPSIYDVMLRHRTTREAQIFGAQLLQKTAIYVPQAASDIGKKQGIQLIIHSMLVNKDSVEIQAAGSAALAALCSTSRNRIIAGKFFAVETIMSATKTFTDERYLQGACMKLLAALASEPENIDIIVHTKSIRLPFRVIKRHMRSKILVRVACECAHQLLKGFDETDMEKVVRMNPMKFLLCAILEHADDERIQTAATECATAFCIVSTACLLRAINGRASDLCVRNLRRFRGSEHGRLHLACMEMLCLFAEAGCQKVIVHAGALEGCLTCMIEMRRVFAMQVCGLRLLELVLATGEESFLQRIIKGGGLEVLNTSLKTYISREGFVERGVRVMRVLRG